MDGSQPIFVQIMDRIESDIVTGVYSANDLIVSTTQIAKLYMVNHTTAVKAVSKLTDAGILYKKRGIGMCVAEGAKEQIYRKRKENFLGKKLGALLAEARTLGIETEELIGMIREKEGAGHD